MLPMRVPESTSRWVLWLVLLCTLPVPFYLGDLELAPALRLGFLAGLIGAVVISEGSGGYLGSLAGLGAGQMLLWWLLLYGLAALVSRLLARSTTQPLGGILLGLLLAVLLGLSSLEIYLTPLSSRGLHSNLAGLFD